MAWLNDNNVTLLGWVAIFKLGKHILAYLFWRFSGQFLEGIAREKRPYSGFHGSGTNYVLQSFTRSLVLGKVTVNGLELLVLPGIPGLPLGSWGFGAPKTFTNEGFGSPRSINCYKALVLRLICLNCVVLVLNKVLTISATCCNSSWRKEETIDNSYKSYISNLLCDVRISRDNILCTHKYIFV